MNDENKKYGRLYQFIKLYLFSASSRLFSCPLSMTDGAAYLITHISEKFPEYITEDMKIAYKRLVSNDPNYFWTSGQWMTEIMGGSDVRNSTETKAVKIEGKKYSLSGLKWFTSAIDADICFTLAKIITNENSDIVIYSYFS